MKPFEPRRLSLLLCLLLACGPISEPSSHKTGQLKGQPAPRGSAVSSAAPLAASTWNATENLTTARSMHTATLLPSGKVLVVGGKYSVWSDEDERKVITMLATAEVYDSSTGVWSSTGALTQAREHHTATVLPGGRALVVGGIQGNTPLATAEVYDPRTRTWSSTGELAQARENHTATLMPNGKVLVVGGHVNADNYLASAEEYDPATQTWSPTGSLEQPRHRHSAALLPDGKLLVVGGYQVFDGHGPVGATEVYDPSPRTWSSAGWLMRPRESHTTTLLPGGQVLVVGGNGGNDEQVFFPEAMVEVYAPAPGAWTSTDSLAQGRKSHTATLMPDGKVLVVGGSDLDGKVFATVELYDPALATRGWSPAPSLKHARGGHTATLLTGGKVLVVGGYGQEAMLASAELYDPATRTWSSAGALEHARSGHTATLLPDGRVLVLGGSNSKIFNPISSAELYDPVTGAWSPARRMIRAHLNHTASLLADGRVLVVGGEDGTHAALTFTEVYDPETGAWSPAGTLTTPHSNHTATLLPGGKIFVAPASEVYDPATGVWSSVGSPDFRNSPTATLLPGGKVLVVGGSDVSTGAELSSAALYTDTTADERWRPFITGVSPTELEHGTALTVTGERFQGGSEASGGMTRSSATNHPLLSLNSVETGRWVPLLGHDFSDTSVSATLPYVPNGYYLLNVTTQGRTASRLVSIINRTPPDTSLGSDSPARVTPSTTAIFSFSSASSASFECNLDGVAFSTCTSPQRYLELPEGEHHFRVRARDPAGNEDASPAEYRWTVDLTNPETVIDTASAPPAFTHLTSARFAFSSEEGASFECSLDGAAFTACPNSMDYASLAEGAHSFQVKAKDRAGNQEPIAAEYRWTVDTEAPQRPDLLLPTTNQRLFTSRPLFTGTAEPGSTVRVFVDGTPLAQEATANEGGYWELTATQLTWGTHHATAMATDPAGNTSPPSLEVSFATVQVGYYGMSCAATPSALSSWPWVLVALGLLRRSTRRV